MPTHEATINVQLGEVLKDLRPHSWRVLTEQTGTLTDSPKRPDILIQEASQWPVVIEAERVSYRSAEREAIDRLSEIVNETGKPIESAIALVYPESVRDLSDSELRDELRATDGLEYALYTRTVAGEVERLPESGWLRGSAKDVAMLAHRASMPAPRIEHLSEALKRGIQTAAHRFTKRHGSHQAGELGPDIASLLGQADDQGGQTRRMAMTVLINALIFHESLAEAGFRIELEDSRPDPLAEGEGAEGGRRVRPLSEFRDSENSYRRDELTDEWEFILERNYWPIFATAQEILRKLPIATVGEVLQPLWDAANKLVQGGVTKSHDLTGVIFQRLIEDRKFLATYYTQPAAASMLAALAIPADRAPGGAEWGDEETVAALQIGDFACGTGTLLSAAYQRISLLHELNGGDPRKLHAPMMKHGLVGLDVLNIAVHLTAATLAGAHPGVPFDGECLLTMPYGGESASIGSLELLAEHVQAKMIQQASAISSGGLLPRDVVDLMTTVGHNRFDLVIMNPPFTRPTNHEGDHSDVPFPAYAAFDTTHEQQLQMASRVKRLTANAPSNDYAGLASHFVELADRKLQQNGTAAFVLPLSAASGGKWDGIRRLWMEGYRDILVVTIAAPGTTDRSFSADTGMAECLLVANKRPSTDQHAVFAILNRQPSSTTEGALIAQAIITSSKTLQGTATEIAPLTVGEEQYGHVVGAHIDSDLPWPQVGIEDTLLIGCCEALKSGKLIDPRTYNSIDLDICTISDIGQSGPVDRSVGSLASNKQRGAFEVHKPPLNKEPAFPLLWANSTKSQRSLSLRYDSDGTVRPGQHDEAKLIWATATRAHYRRDLQFNAQSLIVAMTERKCIGGRAWPSVILHNPEHEYAFSLWSNSTLGLLLHWWVSNKSQAGRGTTTVTAIPNIPTLDTRALSDEQHAEAKRQFELLSEERFLPFDQIDEDPARAKLDHAILVDVLGLPESLVAPDGPIDLIRRKLAREPQIHGGKKSRVVFTDDGEKSVKRTDRA